MQPAIADALHWVIEAVAIDGKECRERIAESEIYAYSSDGKRIHWGVNGPSGFNELRGVIVDGVNHGDPLPFKLA